MRSGPHRRGLKPTQIHMSLADLEKFRTSVTASRLVESLSVYFVPATEISNPKRLHHSFQHAYPRLEKLLR